MRNRASEESCQVEPQLVVVGLAEPLHGEGAHGGVDEGGAQQLEGVVDVDLGPAAQDLDRLPRLGLVLPVHRLDELGQGALVAREVDRITLSSSRTFALGFRSLSRMPWRCWLRTSRRCLLSAGLSRAPTSGS
ncbi:hypothetical protein VTK73DRAFT_3421 [Phialemonium thermophilum]|uniref:Uncharacterized protein n=1 Tax=Phialemonium thermophilum TaxID=223376 RepID=A0ABR3VJ70_9PEZI